MTDQPDGVELGIEHYATTMGLIPDSITSIAGAAPEVFEGFVKMREWVMQDPPNGHLERKIKHLTFCMLAVAFGHLQAAIDHARAGMKAGLTIEELTTGLVQVYMSCGITSWGRTGYKVLEKMREEIGAAGAAE